jgi:hypothetical protein
MGDPALLCSSLLTMARRLASPSTAIAVMPLMPEERGGLFVLTEGYDIRP